MTTTELMTEQQIATLRAEYSRISGIDPCGEAYPKLIAMLNSASPALLKQLAAAQIKFVSKLALNRVRG